MSKRMKIAGGLIIAVLIALVTVTLSLDGIIKSGIENNGSDLLQTKVEVDDVDISIFSGKGTVHGFKVQNPEGFSETPAIQIVETEIEIDLSSIFSKQIVIRELIVKKPELYFEQKGFGTNLTKLNDNMEFSSESPSDKTLVIGHLLVENSEVKVSTSIDRERTAKASINKFELNDVGRDGENTIKDGVKEILEPLISQGIKEAVKGGVVDQIKDKAKDLLGS